MPVKGFDRDRVERTLRKHGAEHVGTVMFGSASAPCDIWGAGNFHHFVGLNTLSPTEVGVGLVCLDRQAYKSSHSLGKTLSQGNVEDLQALLARAEIVSSPHGCPVFIRIPKDFWADRDDLAALGCVYKPIHAYPHCREPRPSRAKARD